MTTSWQEQMMKVFPGSTTPLYAEKIREVQQKKVDTWDAKPNIFNVNGVPTEFFSIGQLGIALGNRSPNTLRAWEREGILPKSPYVKPSEDPRGRRRMYSRDMVTGLIQIAKEEGVLWPHKGIKLSETQFAVKAMKLFQDLRSKRQS